MNPYTLPIYNHKESILEALAKHRVIVFTSPTGSGKTTQLPIILYQAGYAQKGIIGVTQPRRIAAVSVSAFIAKQLNSAEKVAYKMRFHDTTTDATKIKIMTDGSLLQELKSPDLINTYSVIMIDEAHERSLTIDFVLGLLKRALATHPKLQIIISSATINAKVFSTYFHFCPVIHLDTPMFPVSIVYVPQKNKTLRKNRKSRTHLPTLPPYIHSIIHIVKNTVKDKNTGDILIFLQGEQMIKTCIQELAFLQHKICLLPLYARLGKAEQDAVFLSYKQRKVIAATNIAETSITIDGITTVIDTGLAKENHYDAKTYTSALIEKPIAQSSAEQRKGRAGRTQAGTCYRLYEKADYTSRPSFS